MLPVGLRGGAALVSSHPLELSTLLQKAIKVLHNSIMRMSPDSLLFRESLASETTQHPLITGERAKIKARKGELQGISVASVAPSPQKLPRQSRKMDDQTSVTEPDRQANSEIELPTFPSPVVDADQRPPEEGEQTRAVRQNSPSTHSSGTSEQQRQEGSSNDSSKGQGQLPHSDSRLQSIRDVQVEDAVSEKLKGVSEVNIAVVGCYNMGKSTLINSIFFEKGKKYNQKAKEGSMGPCTTKEAAKMPYVLEINGIKYNIYDSPGLQDGTEDDLELLEWISLRHNKIHLVIYCTKMKGDIRPSEVEAMKNITKAFKESIWKNAVIALTFANVVEATDPDKEDDEYFEEVLKEKVEKLRSIFLNELSLKEDTLKKINIYPVGSAKKLILPGKTQDWRYDFWYGCLYACDPEGKDALFELYKTRDYIDMSTAGAKASFVSGIAGIVGGVGCMIAGTALTATVFLAAAGIPLLVGGAVGTGLAVVATAGGVRSLRASNKAKKEEEQRRKRAVERAKK